jgi:hypothetical protein
VAGVGEGDDVAVLLTTSWRTMRRAVLKRNGVPEFPFRQYLFAAQVRVKKNVRVCLLSCRRRLGL